MAACASPTAGRRDTLTDPGASPAYLSEVSCPAWRRGESAYLVARREQLCRDRANLIIRCAREEEERARAGILAGAADTTASPACLQLQAEPKGKKKRG